MDTIEQIKKVIKEEAEALLNLTSSIGEEYTKAVNLLYSCNGKIIVTGIGKSGIIGSKIAATLTSTGTPAFFMHATEGLHGDVGVMKPQDVIIAISNSGESEELIKLIPTIKRLGIPIIAITNNSRSQLAHYSDVVLELKVKEEADSLGLAPTTTTTATLAIGDALAVCLLKKKNFRPEDFAKLHPGGSLGRKLLLTVNDIMHKGEENPIINWRKKMKDAIIEITSKQLGVVNVVDDNGKLIGIITDGDLRRALEKYGGELFAKTVQEVMTKNPVSIESGKLGTEALHIMEDRPSQIMVLPIVDKNNRPIGLVRIHDLVKAGIA